MGYSLLRRNPNMNREGNRHRYRVVLSLSSITNLTVRLNLLHIIIDRDILQELFENKSTDETLND